jgi:4-oxalocrotonate tautomerase
MPFLNVLVSRRPDQALVETIAQGLTEHTSRLLRKPADVTAVAVGFVPPEQWTVGGSSLAAQGLSSFWLDIKVTAGTNTKDEKAAYMRAVFSFMEGVLGPLHKESYILVDDVSADAYGFGGESQEFRYVRAKL